MADSNGPITARATTAADAALWRELRHAALQEAPYAFGSTYARERDRPAAAYLDWVEDGLAVLAFDGDEAVGMGAGYLDDGRFHVIAVWVRPEARRRGVNGAVVRQLVEIASGLGLPVVLDVALANTVARAAYESYGFTGTGEVTPIRDGATELKERMVLPAG